MSNVIKSIEFNNQVIEFEMAGKSIMINATSLNKVYPDKKMNNFLRSNSTKDFTYVLNKKYGIMKSQDANLRLENTFSNDQEDESDLDYYDTTSENILKVVHGGRNNGTWMHEILALKFAAWLNPEFELWVYESI